MESRHPEWPQSLPGVTSGRGARRNPRAPPGVAPKPKPKSHQRTRPRRLFYARDFIRSAALRGVALPSRFRKVLPLPRRLEPNYEGRPCPEEVSPRARRRLRGCEFRSPSHGPGPARPAARAPSPGTGAPALSQPLPQARLRGTRGTARDPRSREAPSRPLLLPRGRAGGSEAPAPGAPRLSPEGRCGAPAGGGGARGGAGRGGFSARYLGRARDGGASAAGRGRPRPRARPALPGASVLATADADADADTGEGRLRAPPRALAGGKRVQNAPPPPPPPAAGARPRLAQTRAPVSLPPASPATPRPCSRAPDAQPANRCPSFRLAPPSTAPAPIRFAVPPPCLSCPAPWPPLAPPRAPGPAF